MSVSRLETACAQGLVPTDPAMRVLVIGAGADHPATTLWPDAVFVQPLQPDHDRLAGAGLRTVPDFSGVDGSFDVSVLILPRARARAATWAAAAAARLVPGGVFAVDGMKTDGIDSFHRALRGRLLATDTLTKAHGRVFAGRVGDDRLADLAAPPTTAAPGFQTAPGVFSADSVDPGSAALAAALPVALRGHVADLGAGWGWLSAQILARDGVTALHMVEADHMALQAARANITDPRAQAHWADATAWAPPVPLNAVVMNPPFHTGRAAQPALGQAFITAAARMLSPQGALWLVANRHLPYETTLDTLFTEWRMLDSPPGFKIMHATRPRTTRKGTRT